MSEVMRGLGMALSLIGLAIWAYGYFASGHPPFVNWQGWPWWIADFMPNAESEVGMAVMLASMVPSLIALRRSPT